MQEAANKQKRITLKTVHEMLDGTVKIEKFHEYMMKFPKPNLDL